MNKAKRVNIVSVKLVRESSILNKRRSICSPNDAYGLIKNFLEDMDREHFVLVSLDTKNQPVSLNICHTGNIKASLVSPREFMKPAILSSSASIMVFHNHPSEILPHLKNGKFNSSLFLLNYPKNSYIIKSPFFCLSIISIFTSEEKL
ncbi:JAB domain-containing protein [Bacillus stercoris]|uniref:JAB domain-containing protein n=1 Tax=Bacillus stercoris TaxID=2054641 RepID=UPI0008FB9DE4